MWKALLPLAKLTRADPKANVTFNLSCSYPSCAELDLCPFFPIVSVGGQLNTQLAVDVTEEEGLEGDSEGAFAC